MSVRLNFVVEGQTEETFVNTVKDSSTTIAVTIIAVTIIVTTIIVTTIILNNLMFVDRREELAFLNRLLTRQQPGPAQMALREIERLRGRE